MNGIRHNLQFSIESYADSQGLRIESTLMTSKDILCFLQGSKARWTLRVSILMTRKYFGVCVQAIAGLRVSDL